MLRFSKRSRITFSTPPSGVPIDRDRQPRLWAERPDAAEHALRADSASHSADLDVLDVDDNADLVDEDDGESDGRPTSSKFELPPPRLPPRKSSALHTAPPTTLKPQPQPALPAPALPTPKAPPKRLVSSAAPVAIGVDAREVGARERSQPRRPNGRGARRPNFVWGAALLVVGAAVGVSVSIFMPQGVAKRDAAVTAAGESVETKATAPNATDSAPLSPASAVAPTTLTFTDTPLDIHVALTTGAPAASAPAASAPASLVAPGTPIAVTSKGSEKPSVGGAAVRVAAAPAPAAKSTAFRTKPVEAPARVVTNVAEAPAPNPVPVPAPAPHRDLAPAAVDALVREQLRSALR